MHFVHEANRPAASQPTAHNNNGFNNIPEQPKYRVTQEFTGGLLEGITANFIWRYCPAVGFRCDNPVGGSPYVVTAVEQIN